jgi:hypothetical protein
MPKSLCESCDHLRPVVSGSGSRFLLCKLSHADNRFPKYPPQPVVACRGYQHTDYDRTGGHTGDPDTDDPHHPETTS